MKRVLWIAVDVDLSHGIQAVLGAFTTEREATSAARRMAQHEPDVLQVELDGGEPDWICDECGGIHGDAVDVKLCERCAAGFGVRWEGRGSIEPETGREIEP